MTAEPCGWPRPVWRRARAGQGSAWKSVDGKDQGQGRLWPNHMQASIRYLNALGNRSICSPLEIFSGKWERRRFTRKYSRKRNYQVKITNNSRDGAKTRN